MYEESLIQTLNGVLNGTNVATTRRQFISDYTPFILNHIPYAQVEPKDFQTALVTFDGPQADGIHNEKPILVWHFGGVPYPIVKAAMLEYNYQRTWDGSGQTVHAAILLGFQSRAAQSLAASPHGKFGLRAVSGRNARANVVADLKDALSTLTQTIPTAVVSGSSTFADLHTFINGHIASVTEGLKQQAGPFNVEFDGPARDNDSHRPFPYTLETLFNDQEKFAEVVWWYFGGRAVRLTKTMRVPLAADDPASPSLFVGYSGPGTFP